MTTTARPLSYIPEKYKQSDSVTITVGPGAGKTRRNGALNIMLGDAAAWAVDEVRAFAVAIAAEEADQQTALENPPAGVLVDKSPNKSFAKMRRDITVLFEGGADARPAMDALQAQARAQFPQITIWTWLSSNGDLLVSANTPGACAPRVPRFPVPCAARACRGGSPEVEPVRRRRVKGRGRPAGCQPPPQERKSAPRQGRHGQDHGGVQPGMGRQRFPGRREVQ